MSKREELADAIVALLNAQDAGFSQNFEAKRRTAPYTKPEEIATVKVTVFTGVKSSERRTRAGFGHTYKPLVVVQKRLPASDESGRLVESDEMQTLVEEIEAHFEALEDSVSGLVFVGFDESDAERESYDLEHMRMNVFSSAISLEFQD